MSFDIVFVGETNDGKTTIVSSLIEDENAEIRPDPGTTREAHTHVLANLKGEAILKVWDTPGFERTDDLQAWFVANRNFQGNLAEKFLREHEDDSQFDLDCEIMRAIAAGAIVVYVAASDRKPQSTDLKQLELIRIIGAFRIALINLRPGRDYRKEWVEYLKREIGNVSDYSPHNANIKDRLNLLDKLAHCANCDGGINSSIKNAREALNRDWQDRLDNLARMMVSAVFDAVRSKAVSTKSTDEAKAMLKGKINKIETNFRNKAQELFHHRNLKIQAPFFQSDATSTESWRLWGLGLSRGKAIRYGTIAGAVIGLAFDIPSGGLTFGIPTAIGATLGGTSAMLYAFSPISVRKAKKRFEARAETRSQFMGALLDRMIVFSRCVLRISHAIRTEEVIEAEVSHNKGGGRDLGFLTAWGEPTLKYWAIIVGKMNKAPGIKALEEKEPEAFQAIINQIIINLDEDRTNA